MRMSLDMEWRGKITRTEFPTVTTITPEQTAQYEQALDILNSYSGNPDTLTDAYKAFLDTKTRSYALAGAAQVMTAASYYRGDEYLAEGIKEALRLLEMAQEVDSTRQEINLVEASIYISAQRLDDARAVLDHLLDENAELTYQFCRVELAFADATRNPKQVQRWYGLAMERAQNASQQVYLLRQMGGFYLETHQYEACIQVYEQLLALNPRQPWTWHNMSIALFELKRYKEVSEANRRALALKDFGAARYMKQTIDKTRPWYDRLFDLFRV